MKKPPKSSAPLFIRHIFIALFAAISLVCLSSCFGNKAPERTYFSIDYTLGTQPKHSAPKYDATVVVQNISSALAYDRQEIVYRANPYEFQYYWYRLWASKPRKMLGELITGHLRYTQLFKTVSTTIEDKLPDYSLDVEIVAIEELDVSETEWFAHLSLRFNLVRMEDGMTMWTYTFDAKRPVADNRPVYVVKAMSELLDSELTTAFQDLDKKLSSLKLPASHISLPETESPESAAIEESSESAQTEHKTTSKENAVDQPKASLKNRPQISDDES